MATTTKKITTIVLNATTKTAWPVLEELIRIAEAADIPLCGGSFGVVTYLIDTFNAVQDNKETYAELQQSLENYTKTLKDFVSVLPATYLSRSSERHAVIARDAIKTFDDDLQQILALLQKHSKRGRFSQWAYHAKVKSDIDGCRRRLDQSHRAFHDAVSNVVVGNVTRLSSGGEPFDEWKIAGAKSLAPHALGRMKPLRNVLKKGGKYDDNDQFVQAEVDGANRVVKVFRGKIGEKAFLNALDFLQTHNSPQFQIYGHSAEANPPFIVFHSGTLVSFHHFLWYSILDKHPNYGHTIQIWECLIDMKEALEFIARRNPDLVQNLKGDTERVGYIQRILEGGMVDESGAVTMDIPDTSAIEQRGTGFWGPSWRMMNSKFNAAHFMANSGVHRLLELPSCRQLSLALDDQPESVLDRTVFEAARQNPYEGILSLREFRERQSTRFPWTTSWLDARLCDIGLFDRKRAAVTKQGEFRKISEMDEIAVSWQIRQPFIETFEVTEVSDGVYRFTFATQPWTSEIQWMTRIEWSTDLARTDDDMRPFARKAKRLANEHGVIVEEIFFATQGSGYIRLVDVSSSFHSQQSGPMSFYLHLDEHPIRYYWTLSDAPLASEAVTAEKGVIDAMDVPQMEFEYSVYSVQLDDWDVKEYGGRENGDGTVSDEVDCVPGGWNSAW